MKVLGSYATKMLLDAVETCERTKDNACGERFVWKLPAYPLYYALEHTTPDLRLRVQKCGVEVDPERDIVEGASSQLYCVEKVFYNQNELIPVHAPLASFGESKLYRFLCGKFEKPSDGKVYFMLFGNMIGTGSPQWLCGDYKAEFIFR